MQLCIGEWFVVYLILGVVYAGVKLYGGWDYHLSRSLYTRAHHSWFEVWFWPIDLYRTFIR